MTSTMEALGWHTIGRLGILLGTPVARTVLRLFGGALLDRKRSALDSLESLAAASGDATDRPPRTVTDLEAAWFGKHDLVGGDPARLTPDLVSVWTDDLRAVLSRPERLPGAATAFASTMSAMFVDRQPVARALDRLAVPTLLLSGDDDPLVDRPTLLEHARRPGWEFHVFDGAGHLLPIAFPRVYADVVAGWLQRSAWRSQESVDPACNAGDP